MARNDDLDFAAPAATRFRFRGVIGRRRRGEEYGGNNSEYFHSDFPSPVCSTPARRAVISSSSGSDLFVERQTQVCLEEGIQGIISGKNDVAGVVVMMDNGRSLEAVFQEASSIGTALTRPRSQDEERQDQ